MLDLFNKNFPLRSKTFFYNLNGTELEFVQQEKDLGIIVTSNLTWDQQIEALYNKASSRLGLLKRTMHFVKCPKQRRAFYLAIVRSQFEHCVQVWRPSSEVLINKLERIQRRAVKWILFEQDHSYNDLEYHMRLRDLNLLPLRERFISSDLVLFHDIVNDVSCVQMPQYVKPHTTEQRSKLRSKIKQPERFGGNRELNFHNLRQNRYDSGSLKCEIEAKSPCFKASFFFRTIQEWNVLPAELRSTPGKNDFRVKLFEYLKEKNFKNIETDIDNEI